MAVNSKITQGPLKQEDAPASVDITCSKVVVVIPSYNEERFIGSVVLKTLRHPVTVIVVDDGSTDDTAVIAAAAGAVVVRQPVNQGKGAALNAGFIRAREMSPDVIVMIDGDGQHLPEELPGVVQPIIEHQADIVVGSRYLVTPNQVPRLRILGHRFFNWLTGRVSGVFVSDSQSGYRAFSSNAYQKINFSSSGFSVESEMQFLAREYGLSVKEVPITIRYSDPPKRSVIHQGLVVLNGVLRLTGQYRPLLSFGLPGMILLVAGILWGVYVVNIYNQTRQLAIGYAMISVLLSIIGGIALSTGITLHSVRGLLSDLRSDFLSFRHK